MLNTDLDFERPYAEPSDLASRRRSALNLVAALLTADDVTERHRKEMLSIVVWKWTEAVGMRPYPKYNLPLVSLDVLDRSRATKLQHEHVWERRWIVDRLLQEMPSSTHPLAQFLQQHGVGCVVTIDEHARLGAAPGQGWARYAAAGVAVWDRSRGQRLDVGSPVSAPEPDPTQLVRPAPTPSTDSSDLVAAVARKAPGRKDLLLALARAAEGSGATCVVGTRRAQGQIGDYYRIHDVLIEEPTPAVAYVHWGGKVSVRLAANDLPTDLYVDTRVLAQEQGHYGVKAQLTDPASVDLASRLVGLALERLREERACW